MNIRSSVLGAQAARAAYLKRYRRIGAQRAPRTRHADIGPACELLVDGALDMAADWAAQPAGSSGGSAGGRYAIRLPHLSIREKQTITGRIYDHALGSKPNHAARAVALPLIHLGVKPARKQVEHPATAPISEWHRRGNYAEQAGHRDPNRLTPRQRRRIAHKRDHAHYGARSTMPATAVDAENGSEHR